MNTKSLTASRFYEVEDCDPIPEDVAAKVRRVICANAVGDDIEAQIADATHLMSILGVLPGKSPEDFSSSLPTPFL